MPKINFLQKRFKMTQEGLLVRPNKNSIKTGVIIGESNDKKCWSVVFDKTIRKNSYYKLFIEISLGCCKECLTDLFKENEMIPIAPNIYECPKCFYPNSKDDLFNYNEIKERNR